MLRGIILFRIIPIGYSFVMTSRRTFLRAASVLGLQTFGLAACTNGSHHHHGAGSMPAEVTGHGGPPTRSLRIPPLLEGTVDGTGRRTFELTAQAGTTQLVAAGPTRTWGYNGVLLGPTMRARRGERVAVTFTNELPEASTVHWHGMILPAEMDGGPHQMVDVGGTWTPTWTIDQPAATLWYHPHVHGTTARQVYAGLAGLFIVDDDASATAGLPSEYGIDDVPLVIQDKTFDDDGSFADETVPTFGIMGDTIMVNGTIDAEFTATSGATRFRILNGSNARLYHLEFADGRDFTVVATDAGLLSEPVVTTRVSISPAERVELVVTIAAGERVDMVTRSGDYDVDEGEFVILRLTGAPEILAADVLATTLPGPPAITAAGEATRRTFTLNGHDAINRKEMDLARIDTIVPAGATELWTVENTVYAHNFHIHGCAFTIVDVDGRPPDPTQRGLKDTVFLPPKATATLAVEFATYADPHRPFMYHCHILRHEDEGMMAQYVLVEPGTEHTVPTVVATPHGGHGH